MNCRCTTGVFTKVFPSAGITQLYEETDERDTVSTLHGDPVKNADGTFTGKKTDKDHTDSIDHIVGLGEGYKVLRYKVVEDQNALNATDHSPVYADIIL